MIRRLLLVAVLLSGCILFSQGGQTPPPSNLRVVFDWQVNYNCAPWTVSCVASVSGIPVCPYGRVAATPINIPGFPPQPYVYSTYPKVDQNGKPIDMMKCVSTLPPDAPFGGDYAQDPQLPTDAEGTHY